MPAPQRARLSPPRIDQRSEETRAAPESESEAESEAETESATGAGVGEALGSEP